MNHVDVAFVFKNSETLAINFGRQMGFCKEDVRCGVIRVCVTLVLILR